MLVGDRYLTDVVYGNRNGLLTIRPSPLTLSGEPGGVVLVSRMFHLLASCHTCKARVIHNGRAGRCKPAAKLAAAGNPESGMAIKLHHHNDGRVTGAV